MNAPRVALPVSPVAIRGDMVPLGAGEFLMGTDSGEGYRADGEGPARRVALGAYAIAGHAVSNSDFAYFVKETGYVTDAERAGWSLLKVKVARVNVMNVQGKVKRLGRFSGKRSDWKKAFVKLKEGEKLELYESA